MRIPPPLLHKAGGKLNGVWRELDAALTAYGRGLEIFDRLQFLRDKAAKGG